MSGNDCRELAKSAVEIRNLQSRLRIFRKLHVVSRIHLIREFLPVKFPTDKFLIKFSVLDATPVKIDLFFGVFAKLAHRLRCVDQRK